jgi:hypothetical protein
MHTMLYSPEELTNWNMKERQFRLPVIIWKYLRYLLLPETVSNIQWILTSLQNC